MSCHYTSMLCDLKRAPSATSETVSQGLYGERLTITESVGGWHRVVNHRDGYEGFVTADAIATANEASTHQVVVRNTLLFESPDIKSSVETGLPFSSELVLSGERHGSFSATTAGAFVWSGHCAPVGRPAEDDLVLAAQKLFTGTPYLWGGRSPHGCDCSALVQLAAHACGLSLPRDSEDQEVALQQRVSPAGRRRGDLVFWPGHVALLMEPETLWHATAHSLNVCREPVADVIDRAGEPSSVRRFQRLGH